MLALLLTFFLAAVPARASYTVRDDWGRNVTLPGVPRRIVSLAPSTTEILFAVGAGSRVVGVTAWCNYPAEAAKLPKVGDQRINEEMVVSLRPDLVVADGNLEPAVVQRLEKMGLKVLVVAPRDTEGVYRAVELVARAVGSQAKGRALAKELRRRAAAVDSAVRARSGKEQPRVLVLFETQGLYTAGPGTFLDELIRKAGGVNIAHNAATPWPVLSEEEVIARNPQVIILLYGEPGDILAKKNWQGVAAVLNRRVVRVDADVFSRPGPRLVEALEQLSRILSGGVAK